MTSEARPDKSGSKQIVMIDTEEDRQDEPTEESPLVGAGENNSEGFGHQGKRRGTWTGSEDFIGLPWWRRPSVYWLLPPYLLFTLAFGGVLVPKLNLLVDLVCRQYFADRQVGDPTLSFAPVVMGADNPQCNIAPVQKQVSFLTLLISALTGALSALTAPKLGALSDRYGRKRLMVISSCGGLLGEAITILAAKYPEAVDYHWLLLGAFFDGATGSFTAGSVLVHSYTSDCTPPSKRGVHIGYLHACLFGGLAFGPLLAGYFVAWTGSLLSIFYVVLGCHLTVILYFWFVLPESLSRKRQMAARDKHQKEREAARALLSARVRGAVGGVLGGSAAAGSLTDYSGAWLGAALSANPLAPLKALWPLGRDNAALRRNIVLLAMIDTIIMSSAMGAGSVTVLYSELMFGWGTLEASRFVSATSLTRVVLLLGLLPVINYVFRIRPRRRREQRQRLERSAISGDAAEDDDNEDDTHHLAESNRGADELDVWLVRLALLSDFAGTVGYVFVRREALFVLCGLSTAFGGLASATVQSTITKHVPAERVGSLLGGVGLLHALGRVLAPAMFNGIYYGTIERFPQAFFVLLASLFGLAVLGSLFVRPHVYMKGEGYIAVPVRDPGNPQTADQLADEELPSDTLPRV
ncbi:MFS general substrate transporter [Xylariomycetidae sp. FL2044]|nr:MFS general substrate transporter [Xylariomycetidae sp. FL2044]